MSRYLVGWLAEREEHSRILGLWPWVRENVSTYRELSKITNTRQRTEIQSGVATYGNARPLAGRVLDLDLEKNIQ